MDKELDYGLKASEFKLQSDYYIHFQTNILRKSMNPLCYRLDSITAVLPAVTERELPPPQVD